MFWQWDSAEWRTRLSSGLCLGSLVEKQMPVPQLLASVFQGKKEASSSRSHTLCRVPALMWWFMSGTLVMSTLVPVRSASFFEGTPLS